MIAIIQFLVWIVGFIGLIWAIGVTWNHWWWVKDGRPTMNQSEQLAVAILRAKGVTKTAARREVIKKRQPSFAPDIAAIRDTEDLLFNPDREAELRRLMSDEFGKQPQVF